MRIIAVGTMPRELIPKMLDELWLRNPRSAEWFTDAWSPVLEEITKAIAFQSDGFLTDLAMCKDCLTNLSMRLALEAPEGTFFEMRGNAWAYWPLDAKRAARLH